MNISSSRARFIAVMSVNGEVVDDGGEPATSGEIEERIEDFKQDKARQKSSFTRIKNKLLRMLDEQDYPSRREKRNVSPTQRCSGTCYGNYASSFNGIRAP